jgi:hypothetical protein
MKHLKLILLLSLVTILGVGVGLFGSRWVLKRWPKIVCDYKCQNAVTPDHRFFSDELILVGQTENNAPFFLYLNLNRKKIADSYSHYYYADFVYQDERGSQYTGFNDPASQVIANDFLNSFSSNMSEDLSARESYAFDFNYKDLHVQADLKNFNGDFLVKNTLDYTKYVSEGDGNVTVNGKQYRMHAFLTKIYSPYYDKYLYFNGYNDLNSLAQFFVLWDTQGNFYLLDKSDVFAPLPDYKSHTWVLYKNQAGQYMKKAFAANVQFEQEKFVPKKWSIYIPDLEANLELAPQIFTTGEKDSGLAAGTVTTPSGPLPISGYFSFHKYGDK